MKNFEPTNCGFFTENLPCEPAEFEGFAFKQHAKYASFYMQNMAVFASKICEFLQKNSQIMLPRTVEDTAHLSVRGQLRTAKICPLEDVRYIPKGIYVGIFNSFPHVYTENELLPKRLDERSSLRRLRILVEAIRDLIFVTNHQPACRIRKAGAASQAVVEVASQGVVGEWVSMILEPAVEQSCSKRRAQVACFGVGAREHSFAMLRQIKQKLLNAFVHRNRSRELGFAKNVNQAVFKIHLLPLEPNNLAAPKPSKCPQDGQTHHDPIQTPVATKIAKHGQNLSACGEVFQRVLWARYGNILAGVFFNPSFAGLGIALLAAPREKRPQAFHVVSNGAFGIACLKAKVAKSADVLLAYFGKTCVFWRDFGHENIQNGAIALVCPNGVVGSFVADPVFSRRADADCWATNRGCAFDFVSSPCGRAFLVFRKMLERLRGPNTAKVPVARHPVSALSVPKHARHFVTSAHKMACKICMHFVCKILCLIRKYGFAKVKRNAFLSKSETRSLDGSIPPLATIFLSDMKNRSCIFCEMDSARVIAREGSCYAVYDGFPVSEGHILIIPERHIASFRELTEDEWLSVHKLAKKLSARLLEQDKTIDGFNLGINDGKAAGQTIFHAHVHLIPRRKNDVENPRGGVRHVIPCKGCYPANTEPER